MKILDYNHCTNTACTHYPNCGWNLHLGGTTEQELNALKDFLKEKIDEDLTDYSKKMGTEPFSAQPFTPPQITNHK